MSERHWSGDHPESEVQRDAEWLAKASPTEINTALEKGELRDLIQSGERGQKALGFKQSS